MFAVLCEVRTGLQLARLGLWLLVWDRYEWIQPIDGSDLPTMALRFNR